MMHVQGVEALLINDEIILLLHVDDGLLLDKSHNAHVSSQLLKRISSQCEIKVSKDVTEYLQLYIDRSYDPIPHLHYVVK